MSCCIVDVPHQAPIRGLWRRYSFTSLFSPPKSAVTYNSRNTSWVTNGWRLWSSAYGVWGKYMCAVLNGDCSHETKFTIGANAFFINSYVAKFLLAQLFLKASTHHPRWTADLIVTMNWSSAQPRLPCRWELNTVQYWRWQMYTSTCDSAIYMCPGLELNSFQPAGNPFHYCWWAKLHQWSEASSIEGEAS